MTGDVLVKCLRHRWQHTVMADRDWWQCTACGAPRDPVRSRRGRTARSRGNRRELELARSLGGVKVGHHGGPEDVRVGMFNVQSKVRAAFPGWMWDELAKLPRADGRIPLLVVTDAPGPGRKRRAIAIVTLDDWRDLHQGEVDT